MVRDAGAIRRAPARPSGAGVGGDADAPPGATSRPPLRAIQPPASGAPRWPVPTASKGLGFRTGKAPARVGAVSTSLAPRKPGRKPASRSGFTTAGTSSVGEPRSKVRDAISFWEENSSKVQQYDCCAPAKVEHCSDEDFMKNSEDILKLHLELDIFKTILVDEKAARAEVEQRTTALGDELKKSGSIIEYLESVLALSIKESSELKKSNDQCLELPQKREMEISRPNSELDIQCRQEHLANEEPKMQTLKFYNAEDSPMSTKLKRMQASLDEALNLNARYQQDQSSHSSAAQEKDEVLRQAEIETAEVILSLQQQLDTSKQKEMLTKQNLARLLLEKNQLSDKLVQAIKENEHSSSVIEEISRKLEEDLIELRGLHNELSKLSVEKQCCEAQMLIFKRKLEVAYALIAESECIATKAQQIAEKRMAYAEEKDKEVKLLERSIEDHEITICELENNVNIANDEAKHERMKREELELELQNFRQQNLVVPSFGNASSSMEYEMVNSVDSIRQQDIQNELLGSQEFFENDPEVLGPIQDVSCTITRKQCMGMTLPVEEIVQGAKASEQPTVTVEPALQTKYLDEPSEQYSLDENLQESKQTTVKMEEASSSDYTNKSDEGYLPKISELEQPHPNEHLEQHSVSGHPKFCGVGVDNHQSRSDSWLEEQLSSPFLGPVVEIMEENELPPYATTRLDDPVNYMRAPSDELKRLRSRNHYERQRTATDRRFWSIEQQDLYDSIYSRAKLADMKWIDWNHIDSIEQFAGIRKRCADLGLEQITSYCCHWDSELIRQFYSTVHISADKTSMTWMTDGRKITTNKRAWEQRFGIPCGSHTEIHSQLFLNDDDKRKLYTAAEYTFGQINGLSPLASVANKILRTTIYPRSGNKTHIWNIIYHIVKQQPFDIIALVFSEIYLLVSDHSRTKDQLLYAPYIMGMIMEAFDYKGPREFRHNSYKPRPISKQKAAGATPAEKSRLELTRAVDSHHKSHQPAGYQPQVEAVQKRAAPVQPMTRSDLFQIVEDGLRPIRDALASMEGRIGRVEDGASAPARHINSSCSTSQIPAPNSSLAPSVQSTLPPPEAPAISHFSGKPSVVHADNPGASAQPVHVRPSPFSSFRWYQKK